MSEARNRMQHLYEKILRSRHREQHHFLFGGVLWFTSREDELHMTSVALGPIDATGKVPGVFALPEAGAEGVRRISLHAFDLTLDFEALMNFLSDKMVLLEQEIRTDLREAIAA